MNLVYLMLTKCSNELYGCVLYELYGCVIYELYVLNELYVLMNCLNVYSMIHELHVLEMIYS